jgi:hypothetical protein
VESGDSFPGGFKGSFRILLMGSWLVECDGCGRVFKHFFNDDEVGSLEMDTHTLNAYAGIDSSSSNPPSSYVYQMYSGPT